MREIAFSKISLLLYMLSGNVKCSEHIDDKGSNTQVSYNKPSSYVELLMDDLLNQKWDEHEQPCYDQIINVLTNVRNSTLWATWIWDSIQLPTGQFYGSHIHLGNYDQCLRRVWSNEHPIATQYCLVDLKLADVEPDRKLSDVNSFDSADSYLRIETKYRYKFNVMSWGICVPAVCQTQSVDRFMRTLFRMSHFGAVVQHPYIYAQHCQVSQTILDSTRTNLLMLPAILLVIIVCACTYYTRRHSESISNTAVMRIVRAFDLNRNAAYLTAVSSEEIKVINGIRFLTASIVVIVHTLLITFILTPANGLNMDEDFTWFAKLFAHSSIIVDTYFMMSGLLLMKSFKPETDVPINPLKLMLKRYLRLIWVYIIATLTLYIATSYIYRGPLWSKIAKEQEACEKTWWAGLIMLGNYVDSGNVCLPVTWYIPADYHLSVLSTIMYWLYQKNRRGGLYLFGLITIVSLILPGLDTYLNKLGAVAVLDFESAANFRELILTVPTYVRSHMRATPYFVGLVAGYILSVYKPANYRKIISTKYSILIFITIMTLCVEINLLGSSFHFREYNAMTSALFGASNRTIWACLIAAFILLCEYGSLSIVTDFLSWSAFVPMSRLSYGIYMLHYILIIRHISILRSPPLHDVLHLFQESISIVVITTLLSLCIWLFVESPLNNLMELVLKTKKDDPIKKKT